MIYRKATLADVPAIVDLAVESVSCDPLPVKINRTAMAETARTLLNPAHFLWVAEQDGKVVASVAACVQPSFWFEKLQCSVLLYYSRVRGGGLPLIREFARWVKSRAGIKLAIIELEPNADFRLVRFLKRLGFARESLNLSYVRGASHE
ncbi:GNAT family N-acetyltransferase [bacterium]|nr:GNAT family N-acetyltransferase [bacterium]